MPPPKSATYAYEPETAIPTRLPKPDAATAHVSVPVPAPVHADTVPPPKSATYAYEPETAIPVGLAKPDAAWVHVSVPVPAPVHADTVPEPPLSVTYAYETEGGGGGTAEPPAAASVVTVARSDPGAMNGAACASRRPAGPAGAGAHVADSVDNAESFGRIDTGAPATVPHVTTLVGSRDEFDLTVNSIWPTRPVLGSTATFTLDT